MILLVEAKDTLGNSLDLVEGETIPQWGGVGDWRQEVASKGYYAGLPGKAFAKILVEMWTEITPTGAYWNPTRLVSDNRRRPSPPMSVSIHSAPSLRGKFW